MATERYKLEVSSPEFRQAAEAHFPALTKESWEITGNRWTGYLMRSSSGIEAPIVGEGRSDPSPGDRATIRHEHSLLNSIVREAYVLSMASTDRDRIEGVVRMVVLKPGEPTRCTAQYKLEGFRQK